MNEFTQELQREMGGGKRVENVRQRLERRMQEWRKGRGGLGI